MVRKCSSSKARVILTAETINLTAAEQQGILKNCQEVSTNNLTETFSFFRQAKRAISFCKASSAERLKFK